MIAQWSDRFQCHVACALHSPLIILLQQKRAKQPDDSLLVWKYSNNISSTLDFAVEPFKWICGVNLGSVDFRKTHKGENICLGFIHESRQLAKFGVADQQPCAIGS